MASSIRAALRQRLRPIRWRDRKLADQQMQLDHRHAEVDDLRHRLQIAEAKLAELEEFGGVVPRADAGRTVKPSFRREMLSLRAQVQHARSEDPRLETAVRQIPNKLRNYGLAASHGIRTPEILGLWPDVESIDLRGMPDRFVLKSDGGAGGQGVFPLQRSADDGFIIPGSTRPTSQDDLLASIRDMRRGKARPPFFAEEFLTAKRQEGPLPQDVKIYAFYGEIGQILLRSVSEPGSHDAIRYRFIWADGSDLGNVSFDDKAPPIDSAVPIPPQLDEMLELARHLSLAVGTPFIRVDVYDTPGGPTLGELTRAPGGQHKYRSSHDQRMGAMWLRARMRLERDTMRGRPPGAIYGEKPYSNFYEALGLTRSGPGSWPVTRRPCSEWCVSTHSTAADDDESASHQ